MQLAPESLECSRALGATLIESSRSAGWTSLLVDHHRVRPSAEVFETAATPDRTIVVMLKGEQHLEVFADGIWHRTVYEPGTVGTTPGHKTDRLRRRAQRQTVLTAEALGLVDPPRHRSKDLELRRDSGRVKCERHCVLDPVSK